MLGPSLSDTSWEPRATGKLHVCLSSEPCPFTASTPIAQSHGGAPRKQHTLICPALTKVTIADVLLLHACPHPPLTPKSKSVISSTKFSQ